MENFRQNNLFVKTNILQKYFDTKQKILRLILIM